jgi:hypothetical protein
VSQEAAPAAQVSSEIPKTKSWLWADASLQGWSFGAIEPEIYLPEQEAGLGLRAPGEPATPDVYLVSPILRISGSFYDRILVDLDAQKAGQRNDLRIFFSTTDHGFSGDYTIAPFNGSPLIDGERRVLVYDIDQSTAAGADWAGGIIQRVRFDLPQGASSEYVIRSMRICNSAAADCQ